MKIGMSLVDLAQGGAQVFMVQLAQGLAGRGHEVRFYLAAKRKDKTHAVPALVQAMEAAGQQVAHPADLLDCEVIQLDGYHGLRRKLPFLGSWSKLVETYHSSYSVSRSGPVYAQHRICISTAVAEALDKPSHLIVQGVPMPELSDVSEEIYDVAILGRIHPVKQHLLFLDVCQALAEGIPALRALILGGHPRAGKYQQKVDARIEELRQSEVQLEITGEVASEEVFGKLQQCKLLLVTSESEGFGRMAVEAMACGVPVIANPVGGLLEVIRPGETGLLAARDQVDSFASLAAGLLADDEERARLGSNGRADAEARFSIEAMLDAYERVYQEAARS